MAILEAESREAETGFTPRNGRVQDTIGTGAGSYPNPSGGSGGGTDGKVQWGQLEGIPEGIYSEFVHSTAVPPVPGGFEGFDDYYADTPVEGEVLEAKTGNTIVMLTGEDGTLHAQLDWRVADVLLKNHEVPTVIYALTKPKLIKRLQGEENEDAGKVEFEVIKKILTWKDVAGAGNALAAVTYNNQTGEAAFSKGWFLNNKSDTGNGNAYTGATITNDTITFAKGYFQERDASGNVTVGGNLTVNGDILKPLATATKKGAISVTSTGSGNAIVNYTINNGVLTLVKGYFANKIVFSGTGNVITDGSISNDTLTLTRGNSTPSIVSDGSTGAFLTGLSVNSSGQLVVSRGDAFNRLYPYKDVGDNVVASLSVSSPKTDIDVIYGKVPSIQEFDALKQQVAKAEQDNADLKERLLKLEQLTQNLPAN
ncbi:hypothetical protein Barb4_02073 [Bacteroidales bacterium Barb4]|nr:hypothetical protein Barb4_02073 [Bacteroidales bacterium Barb4]